MSEQLAARLRRRIARHGPLTVAGYMDIALADPAHGYYRTRDPLGTAGDFVTAPEVSQMFGEIIGLWAAHMWTVLGRPAPVALIEPGPGRGTLMADMLRAAGAAMPDFVAAAHVHLVETSPALRARQRAALAASSRPVRWHDELADVPAGPSILIANEFFDALPVRQFRQTAAGWRERLVGTDGTGAFVWLTGETDATDMVPAPLRDAAAGTVVELSPARAAAAAALAARLVAAPGCALIVDYGYAGPAAGDTFQAVRGHAYADPLADPGSADLTAHVDFAALAAAAHAAGARAHGPLPQARFLGELGIGARAERLKAARPDRAAAIELDLARLVAPEQMGALFKALALTSPGLAPPPPFPPD